jgi:ABC-type transport system involved in cytochrome c biogenesis ATPase subunit
VTALVGPNGTNKTAILRALQGCPRNENMRRYWEYGDPVGERAQRRGIRNTTGRYASHSEAMSAPLQTAPANNAAAA